MSYTLVLPLVSRQLALRQAIIAQWARIEALETELDVRYDWFQTTLVAHCEATLFLMGTADRPTLELFRPRQDAHDHYVRAVHEFGYAHMSWVAKNEELAKAQDKYNELVIEWEDACVPSAPSWGAGLDDGGEPEVDDVWGVEPPVVAGPCRSRKAGKKVREDRTKSKEAKRLAIKKTQLRGNVA
jgi:hypothetical protein